MKNLHFLILFLLSISTSLHYTVATSLHVKYLPGFEGPLPFSLETGYLSVGESEDVELFYYFLKSERNPQKDPLMIWLTGGPGCSSLCGLFFANGPLSFKGDEYNGTLPPLELTSYSWTKVANILYLESPAGSGYSYAKTPRASETSDTKQIHQIHQFLRRWFVEHPEYISNPFYVGGDSYSGQIVPGVVQQISLGNDEKGLTPFISIQQGYVLGNPVTNGKIETNHKVPFAHGMGLISDELFESLEKSCGGRYDNVDPNNAKCLRDLQAYDNSLEKSCGGRYDNVDPNNAKCLKDLQAYDNCISEIQPEHILLPKCPVDHVTSLPNIETGGRRELEEFSGNDTSSSLPPPSCFTYRYFLSAFWANDKNVRRALGVKKEFGRWNRCNLDNIPYTFEFDSEKAIPYHVNNSRKGFRSLIYSGDHDMVVPFSSTEEWIRDLNYSIVKDWRPWMLSSHQVGGYTRTYANKMTFATIKGGGHTAEYNPHQCSPMFKRWIDGEPL